MLDDIIGLLDELSLDDMIKGLSALTKVLLVVLVLLLIGVI